MHPSNLLLSKLRKIEKLSKLVQLAICLLIRLQTNPESELKL